jgi:hypothetical protein
MSDVGTPARYFTWRRFARMVLLQLAIVGGLVAFWYAKDGRLTAVDLGAVAVIAWINVVMALSWRDLMKRALSGELSLQDYLARPAKYLGGSTSNRILIFGGSALIFVIFVAVT